MFNNMFLKLFLRGGERKGTPLYLNILKGGFLILYRQFGKTLATLQRYILTRWRSKELRWQEPAILLQHLPQPGGRFDDRGMECCTGYGNRTGKTDRTSTGKVWQMWQEISGTCHRNISERQYITGPLQGGKGFPVFPERKGFLSRKLELEVWKNGLNVGKNMIGNQKNVPNRSFKRYVSFRQTIRIF